MHALCNPFHGDKSCDVFKLPKETLFAIQFAPCSICGMRDEHRTHQNVGLIDNKKGVVPGNIIPLCHMCFRTRFGLSVKDYRAQATLITLHKTSQEQQQQHHEPLTRQYLDKIYRRVTRRHDIHCKDNPDVRVIDQVEFIRLMSPNYQTEQDHNIMERVPGECYYCGCAPTGLDRIDPKGCYDENNVLPCCWLCNGMRHTMPIIMFLRHMVRVHKTYSRRV
jgi:hypothetical protein